MEIPLNLLRAATASVDYLQGSASLRRESSSGSTAQPVQRGQPLQEGDALTLDPDAFVTVRLADGSTVRVQANSQVTLQQLRRRGRAGSLQTILELEQGGMDIAVPGRPDATRQLEIRTPVAATSVRGTRFNVQVTEQGSSSAVDQGRVALQGAHRSCDSTVLPPGFGAAVDASGRASPPVPRLPAIATDRLPSTVTDAQWLALSLPAVAQASAYQVQVSRDSAAEQVLRNGRFATPRCALPACPMAITGCTCRRKMPWASAATAPRPRCASKPTRWPPWPPAPPRLLWCPLGRPRWPAPRSARRRPTSCKLPPWTRAKKRRALPLSTWRPKPTTRAECALDIAALPTGHYAWRTASVRWVDGQRDQGPFGAVQAFSVQAPPAQPAGIETETRQGHTTLYWAGSPGQRYRVQALASPQAHATGPGYLARHRAMDGSGPASGHLAHSPAGARCQRPAQQLCPHAPD